MDSIKSMENIPVNDGDLLQIETTDNFIQNMDYQWLKDFRKQFGEKRVLIVLTSPSYPANISAISEETMNHHGWYRKK